MILTFTYSVKGVPIGFFTSRYLNVKKHSVTMSATVSSCSTALSVSSNEKPAKKKKRKLGKVLFSTQWPSELCKMY